MTMTETELTVSVPDDVMASFRELAAREYRTPEGQILWLMKIATGVTDAAGKAQRRAELAQRHAERLQAAAPLFEWLHGLHVETGKASCRGLVSRIQDEQDTRISHSTVSAVLNGSMVPSWRVLEKIVLTLGGDVEEARRRWVSAMM